MVARSILLTTLFLALTVDLNAQEQCVRSVADAPAIANFRLGMSIQDVQSSLAPAIKVKPAKSGQGTIFESFVDRKPPASFAGVQALWLRYFENKIYQIEVFQHNAISRETMDELVARLSAELGLPLSGWAIKNNRALLSCGGFSVRVDTILSPHIELTDDAAKAEFEKADRKAKNANKKKGS